MAGDDADMALHGFRRLWWMRPYVGCILGRSADGEPRYESETENRAENLHWRQAIHRQHPQSEFQQDSISSTDQSRLEIKVKSQQQLARVHVAGGQAKHWTGAV